MSNYELIELNNVIMRRFIIIESRNNLISLSIHTSRDPEEAIITPNQAVVIANELLKRAKEINTKHESV